MRYIVTQGSQHRCLRKDHGLLVLVQAGGVGPGQQAGGDISHIAFHAGDLAGEEQVIALNMLKGWAQ